MDKIKITSFFVNLSFLLFCSYPILTNITLRGVVVGLFILIQFFIFFSQKKQVEKSWYYWLIISPFILYLISLFYTENLKEGWKAIERLLTIFLIPLVLYLNRKEITVKRSENIMLGFSISCFLLALYSITMVANSAYSSSKFGYYFMRTTLENVSAMHPTYFSLTLSIAILYLITKAINKETNRSTIIYHSIAILVITIALLIASSKMILFGVIVGVLIILIKTISIKKLLIVTPILLATITLAVFSIKPLNKRAVQFYQAVNSKSADRNNPDGMRKIIYKNSFQAIKDNIWLGVGVGDKQNVLDSYYLNSGEKEAFKSHYNTHSQFLETTLIAGVFSLILLLSSIASTIYIGIKTHSILLLSISILFTLSFISEAVLTRQDGIFSYAFFTSFLVYSTWNEQQKIKV